MARKKILLSTNPPWIHSGLAESGRFLAQWLQRTGKYDLVYYCSQSSTVDPNHGRQPWASRGCIPNDPTIIQQLNQDPNRARMASYGGLLIDQVVKEEKPDILWCSDDIWGYGGEFTNASWWPQLHSILHVTVDSLPILDRAYDQAKSTKHYYTWAKFAAKEMRAKGPEFAHVGQIYGATNVANYSPLSTAERADLRRRFDLDTKSTIFGYTFRNQLRKEALNILVALRDLKAANPRANVKVHLHTSWGEMANGWDFPRYIKYLGLDTADVLCTYVCRQCGAWHVAPYVGEEQDCPHCGAKKSMITPTIAHGVPDDEMKLVYGVRDATISPLTSGGLEYENVNTLLCGLPLATTDYSSGQDFCEQPFVYPIKWHFRAETGTSFTKATNDVASIRAFMEHVMAMKVVDRQAASEQSRDWAMKTFSIQSVGPQWEALFDSMPPKDWSTITLTAKPKNPNAPMPQIADNEQWVRTLYKDVLLCDPDPDGLKNWLAALERGQSRDQIHQYFLGIARSDNAKDQPAADFGTLFDSNGRKRILLVVKESGGDLFICTALFKGLKARHPDADLYVGTDPRFAEVLAGNPYVHRVLAYHPAMDQELVMRLYVDYYICPTAATQTKLNYVTHISPGIHVNEEVLT